MHCTWGKMQFSHHDSTFQVHRAIQYDSICIAADDLLWDCKLIRLDVLVHRPDNSWQHCGDNLLEPSLQNPQQNPTTKKPHGRANHGEHVLSSHHSRPLPVHIRLPPKNQHDLLPLRSNPSRGRILRLPEHPQQNSTVNTRFSTRKFHFQWISVEWWRGWLYK